MASIISSVVMSLIFDSANLRAFCAGVLAGEFDDGDDLSVIFNTSHKIAVKKIGRWIRTSSSGSQLSIIGSWPFHRRSGYKHVNQGGQNRAASHHTNA
jgi:hypothetical protein